MRIGKTMCRRGSFLVTIAVLSMSIVTVGTGDQSKTQKTQWVGCCPGCWMSTSMVGVSTGQAKTSGSTTKNQTVWMCNCPWCPMARASKDTEGKNTSDTQMTCNCPWCMMQKAGVTPAVIRRCEVMMRTPIFIDSPCAIYGQADELKLSEEQKKKLIEIENEARKKAMDVLSDEQKKSMGDISDKPMAMAQMCQQMCSKMMQKMRCDKGKDWQMMCPWMQTAAQAEDEQIGTAEQRTCPVMGGTVNKNIFTEYKSKKVYFCCAGCRTKFEENPEKYVKSLPQFRTEMKKRQ